MFKKAYLSMNGRIQVVIANNMVGIIHIVVTQIKKVLFIFYFKILKYSFWARRREKIIAATSWCIFLSSNLYLVLLGNH